MPRAHLPTGVPSRINFRFHVTNTTQVCGHFILVVGVLCVGVLCVGVSTSAAAHGSPVRDSWYHSREFFLIWKVRTQPKHEHDVYERKITQRRGYALNSKFRFSKQQNKQTKKYCHSLKRYGVEEREGTRTSLPKVIWEQGRVAAAVPGAGWHNGLRIRNVCIVFVKDTCVRKRAVF